MIKSLAEFKRKLKPGVKLSGIFHQGFGGRDENEKVIYKDIDYGIREISKVQSNAFAFKTTKTDGTVVDSWCYFPKRPDVIFLENGITMLEKDLRNVTGYIDERNPDYINAPMIPLITYKFV